MRKLRKALESAEITSDGLVSEVPISPEEEGAVINQIEAEQVEKQIEEQTHEADIAIESLTDTHNFIRSMGKNVDYATHALAVSHAQTIARMTGTPVASFRSVGLEDFQNNQALQLEISMEGIAETARNIWEKIKAFFTKIWVWIQEKVALIGQNVEKLRKVRAELETQLKGATFKKETISNSYLRKVICYRDGGPMTDIETDIKNIQKLFDAFVYSKGRQVADALVHYVNQAGLTGIVTYKALDYVDRCIDEFIKTFNAKQTDDDKYISHNIVGGARLEFIKNDIQTGVLVKSGSIRIIGGDLDKLSDFPGGGIDNKVATHVLNMIDLCISLVNRVDSELKEFPHFEINSRELQAVEKQGIKSTHQHVMQYAKVLLVFYGTWPAQIIGSLFQTAFGLAKFVKLNIAN